MCSQSDPLISKLIQRMSDQDPIVRRNAVGALRLHGSRAIPALSALLKLQHDDDSKVREEARRAMSKLRNFAA